MQQNLSQAQKSALTQLAALDNPVTKETLKSSKTTMQSLQAVGYVEELIYPPAAEGEKPVVEWVITEAGRAAITPDPKPEKVVKSLSDTLVRCLEILSDGAWHTASELNTSHQNHARLVEKGLAISKVEEFVKSFQITTFGQEELAANR